MKLLLFEKDRLYAKQILFFVQERLGFDVEIATKSDLSQYDLSTYHYALVDHTYGEEFIEQLQRSLPLILIIPREDIDILEKHNRVIDYVIKHDMVRLENLITKLKILHFLQEYGVLIVEDLQSYRRYIYNFFHHYYPYAKIFTASSKDEALACLEKNEGAIRLIITDYILHESNGLELVQEIRRNYLFDDIAIIALTGLDINNIVARFLKSGANDFLDKSFDQFEFICRIDNVVKSLIQFEEIKSYSNKDFLTGCFNRRYLYEAGIKMYYSLKRAEKDVSIAICDLDHFKKINDTYGHVAGDLVLKDFAKVLQDSIRGSDFVVRYGGEEFLVFLGNCDKQMAYHIIEERVRKKVQERTVYYDDHEISYNFSCGICDSGESFEEVIKKADEKLYEAKKQRGITVV